MTDSFETLRRTILARLVENVPFTGWNQRALEQAAREIAGDPAAAAHAFPSGIAEAVDLYLAEADRRMEEMLATREVSAMRMRDRITLAVRTRLELVANEREAVRRAGAFLLMPQHLALSTSATWRTVDAMWHAADDRATDSSYYTKRLTLARVYGATLLYWLNDDSPDFRDTFEFLDRQIEGVMRFGKWKNDLSEKLRRWRGPLGRSASRSGPLGMRT